MKGIIIPHAQYDEWDAGFSKKNVRNVRGEGGMLGLITLFGSLLGFVTLYPTYRSRNFVGWVEFYETQNELRRVGAPTD